MLRHVPTGNRHLAPARIVAVLIIVLLSLAATGSASVSAQQGGPRFDIKPVDVDGSYFDIEMSPGESRELAVEIGNSGDAPGTVKTYAANVHSLVNGGMGLGAASDQPDSTTAWLAYEPDNFDLEPGMAEIRTFTVTVPEGAVPGQYITSIVVQAADAEQIGSDAESVSLGAVTRRGMAVAITVPGQATPAMELGEVSHKISGGRSVVSVAVENTGYTRLMPAGEFVLADDAGRELTRFPVTMGLVYARTETTVEIPFSTVLNPGAYSVSLALTDDTHDVTASAGPMPLVVEEPEVPVAQDNGPGVADVDQQPTDTNSGSTGSVSKADESSSLMLIAAGAGITVVVLALAFGAVHMLRRRSATGAATVVQVAPVSPATPAAATTPADQRPVSVRQLIPSPRVSVDQDS